MRKKTEVRDFYCITQNTDDFEIFEKMLAGKNFFVERIISKGHTTPEKEWLESRKEEWVILLKGKAGLLFQNGDNVKMKEGDYILIPKNTKHKVIYTSKRPGCIWLAIHFKK